MDIKKRLRDLLEEGKHKQSGSHKNEYGCVMTFLNVDEEKWNEMQGLIDDTDLYQPEDDPSYGKENEPHVTILFGLHDDIPDEDVEKVMKNIVKPVIKFFDISLFKNKKFEVIKFDVESPNLHRLNKRFKEFPHTESFPKYHPHCTIAYVKPDKGDKYVKELKQFISIKVDASESVYSKADGDKKVHKFS